MLGAITSRTKVVPVCTPNNPTGTIVPDADLRLFLTPFLPVLLVVIDEAYLEFVTPGAPDSLSIARDFPQMFVLRTFSAYGRWPPVGMWRPSHWPRHCGARRRPSGSICSLRSRRARSLEAIRMS